MFVCVRSLKMHLTDKSLCVWVCSRQKRVRRNVSAVNRVSDLWFYLFSEILKVPVLKVDKHSRKQEIKKHWKIWSCWNQISVWACERWVRECVWERESESVHFQVISPQAWLQLVLFVLKTFHRPFNFISWFHHQHFSFHLKKFGTFFKRTKFFYSKTFNFIMSINTTVYLKMKISDLIVHQIYSWKFLSVGIWTPKKKF